MNRPEETAALRRNRQSNQIGTIIAVIMLACALLSAGLWWF